MADMIMCMMFGLQVRELIGLAGRTGKPLQRFYPQCQKCSIKQATAMRNGKRVLVLHLHAPRYRSEHLSGMSTATVVHACKQQAVMIAAGSRQSQYTVLQAPAAGSVCDQE